MTMYSVRVDSGWLLNITTDGFWSLSEAKNYAAEVASQAVTVRRQSGKLRVIIDAGPTVVQSADVIDVISNLWSDLLVDADDRVALLVDSSLAKIQAKRIFASNQWQAFISPSAAKTWLRD